MPQLSLAGWTRVLPCQPPSGPEICGPVELSSRAVAKKHSLLGKFLVPLVATWLLFEVETFNHCAASRSGPSVQNKMLNPSPVPPALAPMLPGKITPTANPGCSNQIKTQPGKRAGEEQPRVGAKCSV